MIAVADRRNASAVWRRTPLIALITAGLLLLAGLVIALDGERAYKAQKQDEADVQARILASTVAAALVFNDRDAAQEYVNALRANLEIEAVAVYDASGSLFVAYTSTPDALVPPRVSGASSGPDGDRFVVTVPVVHGSSTVGTIYLRTITESITRQLERYGIIALLVTMVFLVLVVLGIAQTALSRANANLEGRVKERTSAVEEANRQLMQESIERERAQEEERKAQAQFRFLFANNPLPMWVYDLGTLRFLEVNDAALAKYGYSRGEFIDMQITAIRPEEDVDRLLDDIQNPRSALQQASPWRHRIKNGDIIDVEVSSHRLPWNGREAALVVAEDVTDRKRLEEQLRQSQKMEAVGRLTGGIAHDFNNLLGIITGNLDLLIEHVEGDAEATELAEEALGGALRGAELTQRMLAFARKQPLQPKVIDLNEALPGMSTMLKRTLPENIAVETAPGKNLWLTLVDKSQVEDAILNLAVNARDAMPEGGRLFIETANIPLDEEYTSEQVEVAAGDYVMLSISDTGTGMTPETIERAFEPFFTTKPTGKGTGLGLSMVYGFVKQSGGHIRIYSELGVGTSVKLYLPRAQNSDGPATHDPGTNATEDIKGHETILVVEDDARLRTVTVKVLKELGYTVHEADGAPAALEVLQNLEKVDLVFSDVVMAGSMTGFDLAAAIRERRPGLHILLTTGYSEIFVKEDRPETSIEFINKPYRRRDLALRVRAILDETGKIA
jgi:PAS domain S-box-containing protein